MAEKQITCVLCEQSPAPYVLPVSLEHYCLDCAATLMLALDHVRQFPPKLYRPMKRPAWAAGWKD